MSIVHNTIKYKQKLFNIHLCYKIQVKTKIKVELNRVGPFVFIVSQTIALFELLFFERVASKPHFDLICRGAV